MRSLLWKRRFRSAGVKIGVEGSGFVTGPFVFFYNLQEFLGVGDSGFEPLTSSASKKRDSFLDVSTTYKIPAHAVILALALFPIFQNMRLGCCTVAAHNALSGTVAITALNLLLG